MGHTISYDWTHHGAVRDKGIPRIREVAQSELDGVMDAHFIVVLLPTGLNSSGRGTHVELGIALACGKPVLIWSDDHRIFEATEQTCAFYHSRSVIHLRDLAQLEEAVRTMNDTLPT